MFFKVLKRSVHVKALRVVLVCAVLWTPLSWTSSVRADVKDAKPGDYLEVRVNNEWRKCKVLSVSRTGRQIRVRVEGTGQTLNYTTDRYRELPTDKPVPTKDGDKPAKNGDKPAGDAKGDFRTWTDITGKFRVEAKYVAIENDAVKLVRKDGTTFSVPLAKLSEADQEFAKNIKTNMKADDDNPFKVDDSPPSPMPGRTLMMQRRHHRRRARLAPQRRSHPVVALKSRSHPRSLRPTRARLGT